MEFVTRMSYSYFIQGNIIRNLNKYLILVILVSPVANFRYQSLVDISPKTWNISPLMKIVPPFWINVTWIHKFIDRFLERVQITAALMLAKIFAVLEKEKSGKSLDFILFANWIVNGTVDLGDFGVCLGGGEFLPLEFWVKRKYCFKFVCTP